MICGDIGASGTRIHASDVQCRTETRRKNIVDVKGLVLVYSPIYDTVFIGDVFEGGKGREGESCRVVFSVFGRKLLGIARVCTYEIRIAIMLFPAEFPIN